MYATGYLQGAIGNWPTSLNRDDHLQQHAFGDVDDMRVDASVNISFEITMTKSEPKAPTLTQYVAAQTEEY